MLPDQLHTTRLLLTAVGYDDAAFMQTLVNTEGWLTFIGDRNVHSPEDAIRYIDKLLQTENLRYWVVRTIPDGQPIGVISFLKRGYLPHFDLGFAFLPEKMGQGYAYEAASTVLAMVKSEPEYQTVLATTLPHNAPSIRLLEKLGFQFQEQLELTGEPLLVYAHA